jgi:MFS family permease
MAFMVGAFALGRLSYRVGRKPVLVLGLALFSAQFAGLLIFRDMTWIAVGFMAAGLGNALYDPALSATILDISPPEQIASMLGLKGTAGSLGSMLGPGLVLLMTAPSAQVGFLIGAALVIVLTLTCAFALRVPQKTKVPTEFSDAVVTQ